VYALWQTTIKAEIDIEKDEEGFAFMGFFGKVEGC
jgi:hypothetical protein